MKVMIKIGYKQRQGDHTLFMKYFCSRIITILMVYVHNIIMTENDDK